MKKLVSFVAATVLANATFAYAEDGANNDALIAEALSAAPAFITDDATVHNWQHQTLREGSNGWVCLPTPTFVETGEVCPMCVDATWHGFFYALQNDKEPDVTQMGFAYMLAGDCTFSNISPSAPLTEDNMLIKEGVHMMLLVPENVVFDTITDDPYAGGPYVINEGDPLTLMARASDPGEEVAAGELTFLWDLDNDGVYDDAAPTGLLAPWQTDVPWSALEELKLPSN